MEVMQLHTVTYKVITLTLRPSLMPHHFFIEASRGHLHFDSLLFVRPVD
jgi:hypothetical protein